MTLYARARARRLAPALCAYRARYAAQGAAAVARQVEALNAAWANSRMRSPYACAIAEALGLPARFENWAHYDECVPVMDKSLLREVCARVPADAARSALLFRATGGSTGQPFQFPVFTEEPKSAALDIWLGRSRIGIGPEDPLFLLWGHAHLLGAGLKGKVNAAKRMLSDRLLGYTRVSAYDLAEADLRRAAERLLKARPRYVVGYSVALDRFARVNADRARDIAMLGLRAVIATAEAFPRPDSRAVVSETFGAPVVMEYGTVETGPLAYQAADDYYDVLHVHHRLSRRGGDGPSSNEVLVTSLYPRALPLMRYALGDAVEADPDFVMDGSILRIARIVGRCNDVVTLPSGATIHSEAFTHAIRDLPGLAMFQLVAAPNKLPWLRYAAPAPLSPECIAEVRRRLAVVAPELANTQVERVEKLPLSVAGKHRIVVPS